MTEKLRTQLHSHLRELMEKEEVWFDVLETELPKSWEKHGDLLIFPLTTFASENWKKPGSQIWELVCSILHAKRIARRIGPTQKDDFRRPNVQLLYGTDPWVSKKENGIIYSWDIGKCMFSSGNISEKQRISSWDCRGQVIVDLYAGIGYFTLSYLVHAKAELVYAIEWNLDSIEALEYNLRQNRVESKCIVIPGDNQEVCPRDVADHVNLGLLPSSEKSWPAACQAISTSRGGILHIHGNVDTKDKSSTEDSEGSEPDFPIHYPEPWRQWSRSLRTKIQTIFLKIYPNEEWKIEGVVIHKVKSYGPHIDHLVFDLKCSPQAPNRV